MEVRELVKRKRSLEDEISDFVAEKIREFHATTGFSVNYVNVHLSDVFEVGNDTPVLSIVTTTVDLSLEKGKV